ncbi:anaphase-promoting complex subunit 11 RING-H2 finger-domain containing protein [Nitzschia inconspicua]|uniref:Anaphase-promoting complex subunit 11 RING-H2 finger-domain containing protein n=1 Tax=Nitzschia inconspicua TaxID=303405 RepID=A0A9K3L7F0_9STRA|nr:anaphase-promoting complex subunit 11 RING-H2 finger-domain containing protein [Nitzschia inconspicua]
MGSCASKPQHPPLHERLDEYDEKQFAIIEARKWSLDKQKRWWKYQLGRKTSSSSDHDEVIIWGPSGASTTELESARTSPTSEQTLTTNLSTTFTNAQTLQHSDEGFQNYSDGRDSYRRSTISSERLPKSHTPNDGKVDGWKVKRHGQALQLRLAKHRFLQLAVNRQTSLIATQDSKDAISPLSLDSSFFTNAGEPRKQNVFQVKKRDLINSGEKENTFDESKGIIWKEITRENNVTAIAMARFPSEASSFFNPLLLAFGDEKGVIVVTQITDTYLSNPEEQQEGAAALEFSIEARVRSLDFGDHGSLVAGGDACQAWILQVVFEGDSLEKLVVLRHFERIDRIYDVKFSRDARFLAIGGFDGKCAIVPMTSVWEDRESCNEDDSLKQVFDDSTIELSRPGLIHCLDWSSKYLAVASNKHCALYDARTFELVHETSRRLTTIQALTFNNDGSYLAVGEREVVILEGEHPFRIHCEISNTPSDTKFSQFRYRIMSLCWSPCGAFLAVAGSDGACLVVETKGFALVHQIQRKESINALSWHHQYLVLSDESRNIALVKPGIDGGERSQMDDYSSAASSSHFSASTNSGWVLQDDAFRDIDDCTSSWLPQDAKSQSNVTAVSFSRRRTSAYLAYAADDCSLTIMTTRDWKVVFQIEFAKPIRSLAFSNSSNLLAMGGDESILYVLSVPTRSMILNTIMTSPIHSVAFSKRDERLSIGVEDGLLSMLVVDAEFEPSGEIDASESAVLCQAWSSKTLAIGRRDGTVTLFDTEKAFCNFFVPLAEFSSNHNIRSLSFGVSDNFLAIGGEVGISILSRKGGWILCNQMKTGSKILALNWSPAGRFLAFGGSNQCLQVCDTITWVEVSEVKQELPAIFVSQNSVVTSLDWSLDCKWMAIGCFGSGVHVLNTSNWKLLSPMKYGLKSASSEGNESTES